MSSFTRRQPEIIYDWLVSAFAAILLVSNIVAPKFITLGPLHFSGAQLLFPITYIFGDIFTEIYGYAASRRVIWNGFFASAVLTIVSIIIVWLPPRRDGLISRPMRQCSASFPAL